MASLSGVGVLNDREIEFAGARYVKTDGPAQVGDIVRSETDEHSGVDRRHHFLVDMSRSGYVGFIDNDGDERGIDDIDADLFEYGIDSSELTVFRRVEYAPQTPQSPAEIRAAIERKRAEIAELEAQIAINVDDYVRVVGRTYDEDFSVDDIAQVTHIDGPDYDHPFKLRSIVGDVTDWANAEDIEKISASEAKAALIAQIEEAFEEAQTSA